jgi:hypothetical protein
MNVKHDVKYHMVNMYTRWFVYAWTTYIHIQPMHNFHAMHIHPQRTYTYGHMYTYMHTT